MRKPAISCSQDSSAARKMPAEYYETRERIGHLISLGMPQVTSYTVPAKPRVLTVPEACEESYVGSMLSGTASGPLQKSLVSTMDTRLTTPAVVTCKASRNKPGIDRFDMEDAFAALVKRLEKQLDAEESGAGA